MPWPRDHIKKEKPITVRLTKTQFQDLERLGKKDGRTVRQLMEKVIEDFLTKSLKKEKKKKK